MAKVIRHSPEEYAKLKAEAWANTAESKKNPKAVQIHDGKQKVKANG